MANVARLFPQTESAAADASGTDDVIDQAAEERREAVRIAEALLFAATEPLEESEIVKHMASGVDVRAVLEELREHYTGRGVNLARVAKRWYFRTAPDLGWLLSRDQQEQKKLSKAALETLAIIAYHQPVTRAEIEDIRGVAISRGTIDVLMETGWVRLRGRRKAPGRPVTYGTTDEFLLHFGLEGITDLPGLDELKGAGLFDGRLPPGFGVPTPNDSAELAEDEDPLEEGDLLAFSEDVPQIDPEAGADVISEQDVEAKDVEARLQQAAEVSPELADSAELEDDAEQEPADTPEASEPGAALAAEGEVAHDSGHVAVESLDESASEQRESIEDVAEAIDSAAFEEPSAAASDLENSPAAAPEAESGDPDRKD